MSLTNYTNSKKSQVEEGMEEEIFEYVQDERILRVLFEQKIFKLRQIQREAIQKGLFFRKSFLVCAPSGSGKTLIGEISAVNNVFQKFGKSIYLVPYKALATEKYIHFKRSYERFGITTELSIGDYDVDDSFCEILAKKNGFSIFRLLSLTKFTF
ncbi:MAG: DEAD/DEAH box helicase [Promethearchaeota archaeon]